MRKSDFIALSGFVRDREVSTPFTLQLNPQVSLALPLAVTLSLSLSLSMSLFLSISLSPPPVFLALDAPAQSLGLDVRCCADDL